MNFNTILQSLRNKIMPQQPKPGLSDKGLMHAQQSSVAKGFNSPVPIKDYFGDMWRSMGHQTQAQQPQPQPQPSPTPPASPTPTPIQSNQFATRPRTADFLESDILPTTREAGIQDAIAAGMWAGEGRGEHKYGQAPYNNAFNINATDSNPNGAFQYADNAAGTQAYADLLNRRYAEALQQPGILEQLLAIQNAGYAGDPTTYDARSPNNYPSYSAFVQDTPEFRYYSGR